MLKAADPSVWVVGCQPAASDVMRQSVAAGYIVDVPSGATLSDATAGETHKPYTNPDPRLDYSGPDIRHIPHQPHALLQTVCRRLVTTTPFSEN